MAIAFNASRRGTMGGGPGRGRAFSSAQGESPVAAEKKKPAFKEGHLEVSEIFSDRAAAPSPFGDDQTFPMPVDRVTYKPPVHGDQPGGSGPHA
ncbi:hypothetical protein GCM10010434_039900 [Winogradskya humida]